MARLLQDGFEPDAARERADEILSRPEFAERPEPLIDRIIGWVGEQMARLFSFVPAPPAAIGQVVGYLILAAAVGALAFLLFRFFTVAQRPKRRVDVTTEVVVGDAVGFEGRTRRDWEALAASLEAEGRWREAVRARYGALVSDLMEDRVLSGGDSQTSGELRAEFVGDHPGQASDFEAITNTFEEAWYGRADVEAEDVRQVVDLADRVKSGLR